MEERIDKSLDEENNKIDSNNNGNEISQDTKAAQPSLFDFIKGQMDLDELNINTLSPLVLAFIGDGVYDLVIRTIVVGKGNAPVNDLHNQSSSLVKASAQARLYRKIKDELTDEEIRMFKRGRNAKINTQAKNASKSNYRIATGFEALIGYLYLTNNFPRVLELIKIGLDSKGII